MWQLGKQNTGRLLLDADLTDLHGNPLPAGTYNFTFFGIAETAGPPGSDQPKPYITLHRPNGGEVFTIRI